MSSELVFITGASGFLGSHIVDELLHNGYRVRAAARGPKVALLRSNYARYGERFEAFTISDVATDQFPEAFHGVDAVIHSASPVPQKAESGEQIIHDAIEGTLNVIRQAEQAGIRRLVFTSSNATVVNPRNSFTDKDWNPLTREDALNGPLFMAYAVSKTLAEKALWEFAEAHPGLDITTINPPFIYGPLAEGFSLSKPDLSLLSTDEFIYKLISPTGTWPPNQRYIDARDVAKAHVRALNSPSTEVVGRKRVIISAIDDFNPSSFLEIIKRKRPELSDRLTKVEAPKGPYGNVPFDRARIEEVLGMKKEDFTTFEQTVLAAVDALISLEKQWLADGFELPTPSFDPSA